MKFTTKNNQLTEYALSCGYLQQATETGHQYDYFKKVELSKRHSCYEVFYMDYNTHQTEKFYFNKLTLARKEFKRLKKAHSLISILNT